MKVLLVSAVFVLTSDIARAQGLNLLVTMVLTNKGSIAAIASAHPFAAAAVGVAVVGGGGLYLSCTFYGDFSALNMWVDRITQRLEQNDISTDEDSCWCMKNPPPPIGEEDKTWTLYILSKSYSRTLSTICRNDNLTNMYCGKDLVDCITAVHIIRSLCEYV